MMHRFAFLLLVASGALLGTVIPVRTTFLGKRETNGQRFARGLPPLPPLRGSPTNTARRRQVSPPPGPNTPSGRLQVRIPDNTVVVGYVFNGASGPCVPFATLGSSPQTYEPAYPDLQVGFTGTSLLAKNPRFDPPYVGGYGTNVLTAQNLNTIQFTNVDASYAQGWSLDSNTGQLNYNWTNADGSVVIPTLMYSWETNELSFTVNPTGFNKADPKQ